MLDNIKNFDFAAVPTWAWIVGGVIGIVILILVFKALRTLFWPVKIILSLISLIFTVAAFVFILYSFGVIDKGDIQDAVDQYGSGLKEYVNRDTGLKEFRSKN